MAIQKSCEFETEFGVPVTVSDCYIKVATIDLNKENAMSNVVIFDKKDGKILSSKIYPTAYNIDGSNPIEQAYTYLKTLDEFAGATDV